MRPDYEGFCRLQINIEDSTEVVEVVAVVDLARLTARVMPVDDRQTELTPGMPGLEGRFPIMWMSASSQDERTNPALRLYRADLYFALRGAGWDVRLHWQDGG